MVAEVMARYVGKFRYFTSRFRTSLSRARRKLWDTLLVGGGHSERLLVKTLMRVYESKFRVQWIWSQHPPHFEDQRIDIAYFAFGDAVVGPYSFNRGFFSSEVIRPGDDLLDIGCGDGFFTRRFFAERCAQIDGIDIEPSAIEAARLHNSAPHITYRTLDAVKEPFPRPQYDVIVWDGAIAHFPSSTLHLMLRKIQAALSNKGIFVGSESLGLEESADHLQVFPSLGHLGALFRPYFKHVELRAVDYRIIHANLVRTEAYWRCTDSPERLDDCRWKVSGPNESDV